MIKFYITKKGDAPPPLPGGLKPFSNENLYSRFGFKAVERNGKFFWEPGTEKDFREAEAERLGIKPEQVDPDTVCGANGAVACWSEFCPSTSESCNSVTTSTGYTYCSCLGIG